MTAMLYSVKQMKVHLEWLRKSLLPINTIRAYWMEHTIHTSYLRTVLLWSITVRVVVVSYRRCGTTSWSHVQGALNMGPICCPETSVRNYNYTPRNSPEELISHLLRCGSLKSRILRFHLAGVFHCSWVKTIVRNISNFRYSSPSMLSLPMYITRF